MSQIKGENDTAVVVGNSVSESSYRVYSALKYVPVILYVAFSVFVFGAFAAPIAKIVSPNSGIPRYAAGNVYTAIGGLLNYDVHVRNTVITFFVVAVIGVGYSIFALLTLRRNRYAKRDVKASIGASFAGNVSSGFYVMYIMFTALSFIIVGRIHVINEGLGVVFTGAAVWILLFAMLFVIIASIISVFIRHRMEVKYNGLRAMEQSRL